MKRPNLYILGGQKCGTSALAHFLAQHPDIYLPKRKEAHIFDHPDIEPTDFGQLDLAYQDFFADSRSETYACDATPIYGYWSELLTLIANYSPDTKVIFMVRDPVERAVSQYMMETNRGDESLPMLRAFLKESDRLSMAYDSRREWTSPARWASYLERGRFQQQVEAIYAAFSRENVLILHNDDLRYSHHDTMRSICAFLNIPYYETEPEAVFSGSYRKKNLTDCLARAYARWKLKDEIQFVRQFRQSDIK
ncbi:Sulfotransferase domain protein [Vibrio aerogenes CECT 7868]|uniref:Sulfotransferase domain protein n=1 Tax=Vibrio aerogenes CECT 7868 TaxID=1216006 RepID=A0A1M5ZCG8_9VIBR|nr:sulfotransferase [Vibrio aerogenes]SHI21869.1 Sulfotransferase domain protein [Vibrio aerogenes CECT 7868]